MQTRRAVPFPFSFPENRAFLFGSVAACILVVVVSALVTLVHLRRAAELRVTVATQNLVRSLDQTMESVIDTIDISLLSAADEISHQLSTGRLDPHSITSLLIRQQQRLTLVDSLRATNRHGQIIYGPNTLSPPIDASDRDYFVSLRDHPNEGLFISKPIVGRLDQQWVWLFARRYTNPDGSFGGVVFARLPIHRIDKLLAAIAPDSGTVTTIRDAELGIIARHTFGGENPIPYRDKNISERFDQALQANPLEGTYVTSIDGVDRTQAYRRNAKYGFIVNIGIAGEAALAEWRGQAEIIVGLLTAFVLAVLALTWQVNRAWRHKERDLLALEASSASLREAQLIANLGQYAYDLRADRWTSSDILDEIFGIGGDYPRDSRHWLELVAPDSRSEMQAYLTTIIEQRKSFDREYRVVRVSDGEERWVHGKGKLHLDAQGSPLTLVGTIQDITEHKLAEVKLAESEARNRRMIETSNEGILSVDADRRITYINTHLAALLGYTADEMTGHPLIDFLFPEELADHQQQMAARERGEGGTYERRLRRKDGSELRVQVSATPITDGNGRYAGSFGMFADITERYRAQHLLAEREQELRAIIETAPECVKRLAADGTLLHMNRAGLDMIEADCLEQVVGRQVQHLVTPEFREAFMALVQSVFAGNPGHLAFEVVGLKGRRRWLETYSVPLRNPLGQITALLGLTRDITANRLAEAELRIAAAAFESQEGMFVTDAAGVILKVNRAFTNITGYSAEEAIGQNASMTKSGRHDAAFYAAMWTSLRGAGAWHGEIWNRRKNGDVFPEWLTITAVKDANGETSHYVSTLTDITARKEAENEIRHLAFYDPLTRLPNRRLLHDRLQQALASSTRSGREGALLFIDLDNFKDLNDTLGHDIGDLLLQQVAQRLTTCIREGDTVARLGGDEFVVMLEDLSANSREAATQTETVGEKIMAALNQTYQLAGHEHHSTPSIGATLFDDHAMTVDELLKRGDLAMYQAKAAGRNTLRFFDPEMQAVVSARAALEEDLRVGLRTGQFLLYYQVQVGADGSRIGAEVLVRWQHPERGVVSPFEFIPLAEETGLILPLGHWVLETACAQLMAWAARPDTADLTLAVNVSARQFHHPDFVAEVVAVLDKTGANPHKLKLELTESMLVHDLEDIIIKMATLKQIGVRFSLDDFGTGYSSLSYLKRLPLDQLKIDQSFVRDVFSDINDGAIAQTIIALSQTMGLTVIAEGVETEEQRDFLARLGCLSYQGYLFGRPVSLAAFEEFMKHDLGQ